MIYILWPNYCPLLKVANFLQLIKRSLTIQLHDLIYKRGNTTVTYTPGREGVVIQPQASYQLHKQLFDSMGNTAGMIKLARRLKIVGYYLILESLPQYLKDQLPVFSQH